MNRIVFSLSATIYPEVKGVICTLIPVFRTAPEPFGRTDKRAGEIVDRVEGKAVNWLAGSIFTTARASYFPSPTTVKSL
jgi:hypothetical protein